MSDKLPHVTQSTYTYNLSVFIECVLNALEPLMTVARQPQSKLCPVCVGDATARPTAVSPFASMCVHFRVHVCTSMLVSACVCVHASGCSSTSALHTISAIIYVCVSALACRCLRMCGCTYEHVTAFFCVQQIKHMDEK